MPFLTRPTQGVILIKLKRVDKVVYAKYSGTDIKDDADEDYLLISEKDILAIIEG